MKNINRLINFAKTSLYIFKNDVFRYSFDVPFTYLRVCVIPDEI